MKFKLSWLRAIEYFMLGYLVATVAAFAAWFIAQSLSEAGQSDLKFLLWAVRMVVMPLMFYWLAKLYLQRTQPRTHEGRRLAIVWLVALAFFDFAIYIVVVKFKIFEVYVFPGQPWLIAGYLLSFIAPLVAEARKLKLTSKTA